MPKRLHCMALLHHDHHPAQHDGPGMLAGWHLYLILRIYEVFSAEFSGLSIL